MPLTLSRLMGMEVLFFQHCTLLSFYLISPCTLEECWDQRLLAHEGISLCNHFSASQQQNKRVAVSGVWPGGGRFLEIMTRIGFLERRESQGQSSWPVIHFALTEKKPRRKCWILRILTSFFNQVQLLKA